MDVVKNFRYYSQRVYISLSNGDIVVYKRSDDGKNLCLNLFSVFNDSVTLLTSLLWRCALLLCVLFFH